MLCQHISILPRGIYVFRMLSQALSIPPHLPASPGASLQYFPPVQLNKLASTCTSSSILMDRKRGASGPPSRLWLCRGFLNHPKPTFSPLDVLRDQSCDFCSLRGSLLTDTQNPSLHRQPLPYALLLAVTQRKPYWAS